MITKSDSFYLFLVRGLKRVWFSRKSGSEESSDESSSEESESSSEEESSDEDQINDATASNHVDKDKVTSNNVSKNSEQKSNLDLLLDFSDLDANTPVLTPSLGMHFNFISTCII